MASRKSDIAVGLFNKNFLQYFSKNLKTCIILKPILIIIGVLFVIFSVVQIFAFQTRNGIENYPFTVTKTYRDFEVRNYEASLFTSVKLSTEDYEEASSSGFSILAGYIFGGNENGEKIAMTSPVAMSLGDSMTVMFMVPKKIKKEIQNTKNQIAATVKGGKRKKTRPMVLGLYQVILYRWSSSGLQNINSVERSYQLENTYNSPVKILIAFFVAESIKSFLSNEVVDRSFFSFIFSSKFDRSS